MLLSRWVLANGDRSAFLPKSRIRLREGSLYDAQEHVVCNRAKCSTLKFPIKLQYDTECKQHREI
jgi:hypothetical protein